MVKDIYSLFKRLTAIFVFLILFIDNSQAQTVINNNYLRFGTGNENSINTKGGLQQPFYYNASTSSWRKLTFSSYSLDNTFAVGGDGSNEWTPYSTGSSVTNPNLSGQVIDKSAFHQSGLIGYGTIKSTGTFAVGGITFRLENTYTIPSNKAYIEVKVKLTNLSSAIATNVRMWNGTGDDYIGSSDRNTKQKGNLVDGSFVQISNTSQRAAAIKVFSGTESILFYTTSSKGNTIIGTRYGWSNYILPTDPYNSITSIDNDDGSYGFYVRFRDLNPGQSDEFVWYYAAGALADIDDIINDVATVSGAVNNITYTTADFRATASADATGYWMVVPRNASAPSAAQIKAGSNYGSVSVVAHGSSAMTADVEKIFNISNLSVGTNYDLYFVSEDAVPQYSDVLKVQFATTACTLATLTTNSVTSITNNSASSGGNVTADGGASISARGICWNTTGTPTLANSKTTDGTGTGSFSSSMSSLTMGTTYYVRAYASNSAGTAYGNQLTFSTLSCTNPTSGGTISANQESCTAFDPAILTNSTLPSGHNGTLEYKWQVSTTSNSAGFSDISSSNSANYDPPLTSTTSWYRRLARVSCKDDWTGSAISNVIQITIYPNFEVGSISGDQTICYNVVPSELTGVAPTGGSTPYTYQWQHSINNITFSDIAGASGLNYQPNALTTTTYYRQIQTSASGCGSETTNVVTVTGDIVDPVITAPEDIVLVTTVASPSQVVHYDLPSVTDNCLTCNAPTSIPGYTFLGVINGHTYFRSNAATSWTTANTNANNLGAHLVTITSAEENTLVVGNGGMAWIGFTDASSEGNFQWVTGEAVAYTSWASGEPNDGYPGGEDCTVTNWSGNSGKWNDLNANYANIPYIIEFDCAAAVPTLTAGLASGSVFPFGETTVSYSYTDPSGNTSTSSFKITVIPPFIVGSISDNQTICYNTIPSQLSGNAPSGGATPYSYQWQRSSDGVSFSNIEGATNINYQPPALIQTTYYRQIQRSANGYGEEITGLKTITVHPDFSAGSILNTGETIEYNGNPTSIGNSVAASGGNSSFTYQWKLSTDDFATSQVIAGASDTSYDPPSGLKTSTSYRRYAHDGRCNTSFEASTATWKVIVRPLANDDGTYTVNCNSSISGNLISNDICANGDDLDVSSTPVLAHGSFTSFNTETGAFTYAAPNDWEGSFTFSYTISDGVAFDQAIATILVVNRSPVPTADNWKIYPGESLTQNVLANDTDPDTQSFTVTNWGVLSSATASRSATTNTGSFTFSVPASLTMNYTENVTFDYTVSDVLNATANAGVSMSIVIPSFSGIHNFSNAASWNAGRLPLSTNDIVVENGAILTVNSTVTIRNLTVKSGGEIIVADGQTLTVTESIYDENNIGGKVQINNGGAIVLNENYYVLGVEKLRSGGNSIRLSKTIQFKE